MHKQKHSNEIITKKENIVILAGLKAFRVFWETGLQRILRIRIYCIPVDELVLLGNHRDAWVFGAADASSGTAAMMELSRVLGVQLKKGNLRDTLFFFYKNVEAEINQNFKSMNIPGWESVKDVFFFIFFALWTSVFNAVCKTKFIKSWLARHFFAASII